MFRRIYLITLALTAPALHGMWCFDQSFKDSYRKHVCADIFLTQAIQANRDFEAKIVDVPIYHLLVASLWGHYAELARAPLHNRVGAFQMPCISKILTLQKLQNRIELMLPLLTLLNPFINHKNPKMEAGIITKILLKESMCPGYQSFFHGADGRIAVLFELHKKLYAKFHGEKPIDFEFLRARDTRKTLVGITREEYIARSSKLDDTIEPWRTELLSITYVPWSESLSLFLENISAGGLFFKELLEEILTSYNLPMPYGDKTINSKLSKVNHGLLLHILMKNEIAHRLAYHCYPGGTPVRGPIALPDAISEMRLFARAGQARIILDPTVFDTPSDDVKIIRYQQLSDEEQKKIDAFCDNLIADAEKLKAEQKKDRK